MPLIPPFKSFVLVFFLIFGYNTFLSGQMRQIYLDDSRPENEIYKISFYTPSSGYVAFKNWIGYSIDSGHTFIKKYITVSNVDFNGYGVNLTLGFGIAGVKAFNQNNIIVWGDYGYVPAILRSTDGGNSFKLVYHSQYNPLQISGGVTDMIFPQNDNIGFAIDADRILKTTDQGISWQTVKITEGAGWQFLEAVDNNNVYAGSTRYQTNQLIKTSNGGNSWQNIAYPKTGVKMSYAYFVNPYKGWLNCNEENSRFYTYITENGGTTWNLLNDPDATPMYAAKIKFIDDNTGYALTGQNNVAKSVDGGKIWEMLPRDNSFAYLGYTHNDLYIINSNQLWAGGRLGFFELGINGGGTPLPKAYLKTDTTSFGATGLVNLKNFSRAGYSYTWIVNGKPISNAYESTYTATFNEHMDTIQLVVSNGSVIDTATKYIYLPSRASITAFNPTQGKTGTEITITGTNFYNVKSVTIGGAAASFTVESPTVIKAFVGSGASGDVTVSTTSGSSTLPGFIYFPPPTIVSFSPATAAAGTLITITGTNFTDVTKVTFGGETAMFTVVSPTLITATAPSSGPGTVSVTASGGNTSLHGFISIPTITSFTPLKGTQGTIMTITGTSLTGTTAVAVGGEQVLSFVVVSSTRIKATIGAGASGSVNVSAPGGSSTMGQFNWFLPPAISSFSPTNGPIGTTVTISGSNFHITPSENIVYFGAVRATVMSGTSSSLTVKVPAGATFEAISVVSNNLIGYSAKPFLVTFMNGGSITPSSFAPPVGIYVGPNNGLSDIKIGDMDNDGKPDIIAKVQGLTDNSGLFVYRNISTLPSVAFDTPVYIRSDYFPVSLELGDLDGDGKLDIVVGGETTISAFRNISTPGNILIVPSVVTSVQRSPVSLAIGDIDGDGKSDIAASFYPAESAIILRNTSEPGSFSFAEAISIPSTPGGRNMLLADIDRDAKPDLIIPNATSHEFLVLNNTSSKGNIIFKSPVKYPGYSHSYMAAGDIDGDGITDLVSGDYRGSRMTVLRNNGYGEFEDPVQFDATGNPGGLSLGDIDGDGKIDIAACLVNVNLGIFKNLSTSGIISLAPKSDYSPIQVTGQYLTAIADFNGDGKNDVLVTSPSDTALKIYINKIKPEPFIQSFSPTTGEMGTIVNITGVNFSGATAVSFGGIPAQSFTVNSSTSITAVVGPGSSGEVAVTNDYGTATKTGFLLGTPPVITSFAPSSARVGTSVVINGYNFNEITSGNIVYFGGVRATVTSASTTSLSVIVPAGASYSPITVSTRGLTAYSAKPFSISFPGSTGSMIQSFSGTRLQRSAGRFASFCDIDGDGKLDMVTGNQDIIIARNMSTPGNIQFAEDRSFSTTMPLFKPLTGDLDGDGKPDIVSVSYDGSGIAVFRNTSTVGDISITHVTNFFTGVSTSWPSDGLIHDLDGDGKPDIVIANYSSQTITIFRNLSEPGNIVFDTRIDYNMFSYSTKITTRDIDGDNKPDLLAMSIPNGGSVFLNTSIPGKISFSNKIDYGRQPQPNSIYAVDMDGDEKPDMLMGSSNEKGVLAYRNISMPGAITFEQKKDIFTGTGISITDVGDLDGDGKPDLLQLSTFDINNISIQRNMSEPASINLDKKIDIAFNDRIYSASIADIDGDGMPDISVFTYNTVSFLLNTTGKAIPVKVCPKGTTSFTSAVKGNSYQWQQYSGSTFVNISENAYFSGTQTATLQIINVPASWNNYQYRCVINANQFSEVYGLSITDTLVTPVVNITSNTDVTCPGNEVLFTAYPVNGGETPSFQWQVNGVNVGTNTHTFSSETFANDAEVNVIMTSSALCPLPQTVKSNTIKVKVNLVLAPSVKIEQEPGVICPNTHVTFNAIPVNGGQFPSYEWRKNGVITGNNSPSYTPSEIQAGDSIYVMMTSDIACPMYTNARSSTIHVVINPKLTPAVSISGNANLIQGQATSIIASPENEGNMPLYMWQDSTQAYSWKNIPSAASGILNYQPKQTGDKIRLAMTSNADCGDPATVTSNTISFFLTPGTPGSGRIAPNPVVGNLLVLDSLNISDNWRTLDIFDMGGNVRLHMNLATLHQIKISVPVTTLQTGTYFIILRNNNGAVKRMPFVKL
ncbi:MAG: hypothetical protein BGP13_01565 [Sphingobacteriales bacterium 40-81]|nr:MAG: hypothetical protein BGP13_01565 [Sphingobacteriales bacterium 40-81]